LRFCVTGSPFLLVRSPPVIDVSAERFEELVADALDTIPDELARYMDNVAVFVEEGRNQSLLGLYHGIPLTRREAYGGMAMPDRITIYRLPICSRSRSEEEVVEQVRITVVHEVAHHFGISDARLRELGYG
jgi:predicted Zn-dependent protease with MMP-like domain